MGAAVRSNSVAAVADACCQSELGLQAVLPELLAIRRRAGADRCYLSHDNWLRADWGVEAPVGGDGLGDRSIETKGRLAVQEQVDRRSFLLCEVVLHRTSRTSPS